jgi:hypothetical protein
VASYFERKTYMQVKKGGVETSVGTEGYYCIMKNFKHGNESCWVSEMKEIMTGQTRGLYRRDKICIQNFDGEPPGK